MSIKTIAIVGAGQMGGGIAQVLAAAGLETLVFDERPDAVKACFDGISKRLSRQIEKGTLTEQRKESTLSRLNIAETLQKLNDVDLVIEAIVEDEAVKIALLKKLDQSCKKETIFASNTSSISITKLAQATNRPEKLIGMHFMNPVPVMKLVEIIRGLQTSDETYKTIYELCQKLDKTPVTAKRDFPGFIVNRILLPMINEAAFVLMEGIATAEDIDQAMMLGTNVPMGPLTLADFIGLDTCVSIARIFHKELGDDKYRPCPLMVKYVEAGWLGRKTGRGFYVYDKK